MEHSQNFHPTLYTGFVIEDSVAIKKFICAYADIEQYELTNDKFLNLSKNILKDSKEFMLGSKLYHYSISKSLVTPLKTILGDQNIDSNNCGFSSIAGMEELKDELINDVINPLRDRAKYEKFKIKPPNGILLFGPPGCGKTYIAKKLGEELGIGFIEAKHSDFASIYVHGATEKIGKIFRRAKENSPCLLFIDEIDGVLPKRTTISGSSDYKHEEVNEFLMQMNRLEEYKVILIAASNRPEQIDEAVLRTGRIDKIIYVPPPDRAAIIELFRMYLSDRPLANDVRFDDLANNALGYSSSDIEYICNEAARNAVVSGSETITDVAINKVIERTKSSITTAMLKEYENFKQIERK